MKKFCGIFAVAAAFVFLCMPVAPANGTERSSVNYPIISKDQASNEESIVAMLEKTPIVFVEADFGMNGGTQMLQADNAANVNEAEIAYEYYYKSDDNIQKGEIYATPQDTEESIAELIKETADRVQKESDAFLTYFNFGSAYLPVQRNVKRRSVNAVFNGETLGIMTDYEQTFILNNPANEDTLYLVIAHETYLFPASTKNRNFKGVGVEMKLNKVDGFNVRDYAPKMQGCRKISPTSWLVSAKGGFSGFGAEGTFGFGYYTNIDSPKIRSVGEIGASIVDIIFEYVDPGAWEGGYFAYNSDVTVQCSCVVLQADKANNKIQYTSGITGRFQKYENWPFPWVDEYYTIPMDTVYNVSDLLRVIENANA